MEKRRKEGRREGNEEIAAPKSRDRRARELASSPLIISETRIHILRKSRGELSRGRDEKVEREITSRRGGIKCEERARPDERDRRTEKERGRERERDVGRRWRPVQEDGDEANGQADGQIRKD